MTNETTNSAMGAEEAKRILFASKLVETENAGACFRMDNTLRYINRIEDAIADKDREIEELKLASVAKDIDYTANYMLQVKMRESAEAELKSKEELIERLASSLKSKMTDDDWLIDGEAKELLTQYNK